MLVAAFPTGPVAAVHPAGLEITVDHAPGHTPGSVAFRAPATNPYLLDLAARR